MTEVFDSKVAGFEPLVSPLHLRGVLPLPQSDEEFIVKMRNAVVDIMNEKDPRLLLIVGPCSIHDLDAGLEYATKLKELEHKVSSTFLILMRVYFEKPRTCIGWKGMLYDPHLDGSNDIQLGVTLVRKLLLTLAKEKIPVATEFIDPLACAFVKDLITWGSIGARTAASQLHRQLASSLPMPVGFKNGTDGNLDLAINGVIAARCPHSHLGYNENGIGCIIHSMGNPHTHIVLRGGETYPNYTQLHILDALNRLKKHEMKERIIVDCSHDNSYRNHQLQIEVFQNVMRQVMDGQKGIFGLMLESNLSSGNQKIPTDKSQLAYGVSITDPCLNFGATEKLILDAYKMLNENRSSFANCPS